MRLESQDFYVLTPVDFVGLVHARVMAYEQQLAGLVLDVVEIRAATPQEPNQEQVQFVDGEMKRIGDMMREIRLRIDALRAVSNGEFDQPKRE